jgi:nuclear pore complex protein Nup98-Nup96
MEVLLSLGYSHLSAAHHTSVCVSYASQLESLGLWHWAVFVLLHLYEPHSRSVAVQQMLERHVSLNNSTELEKEIFLINSLHVPIEWIHEAKALRAKAENNYIAEAWHLLQAKQWNRAHSLIISHIAPEAIVNGNHQSLCTSYLLPLANTDVSSQIQDWANGGALYLDYCNMLHHFNEFNQGSARTDYELEELRTEAVSVGSRVNKLQCRTAIDNVCQSEMAKNVAKVMTTLLSVHDGQSRQQHYVSATASHVNSLVMPEDYALEALGHVSHALLRSAAAAVS